jgi:hypothetical protein
VNRDLSAQDAASARDAGLGRLRRLTGLAIGAAIVLSGAFAGIAAKSSPGHKAVAQSRRRRATSNQASAPALPPPRVPSAGVPEAPAAPPASAPASVAPVVVSGGS